MIFRPEHPLTTGAELERLLADPLDVEREAWRAARKRYAVRRGVIVPLRSVGGASFLTGTQSELIYANSASGTAKNTWTTEAVINDTAGMGAQPILPPYFWLPQRGVAQTMRVVARGLVGTTTAAPTFTWTVRLGGAASTAGPIMAGTAALTSVASISNKGWELEFDAILRTTGAEGANSTLQAVGMIVSPAGLASPFGGEVWGGAAQPGTVSIDVSITNHINFNAACGTSNAANQLQLLQLLVFGLN